MPSKQRRKNHKENYRKKRKEKRANAQAAPGASNLTELERTNLDLIRKAFPECKVRVIEQPGSSGGTFLVAAF